VRVHLGGQLIQAIKNWIEASIKYTIIPSVARRLMIESGYDI
jgi:hypothetical protein